MIEGIGVNVNSDVKQKKTGGAGKAIASAFVPGLGQFCDGRNKEGVGYMAGTYGLGAIGGYMLNKAGHDVFEAESTLNSAIYEAKAGANIPRGPLEAFHERVTAAHQEAVNNSAAVKQAKKALEVVKKSAKKFSIAGGVLLLAGSILGIANIVDAYKGDKNKA